MPGHDLRVAFATKEFEIGEGRIGQPNNSSGRVRMLVGSWSLPAVSEICVKLSVHRRATEPQGLHGLIQRCAGPVVHRGAGKKQNAIAKVLLETTNIVKMRHADHGSHGLPVSLHDHVLAVLRSPDKTGTP